MLLRTMIVCGLLLTGLSAVTEVLAAPAAGRFVAAPNQMRAMTAPHPRHRVFEARRPGFGQRGFRHAGRRFFGGAGFLGPVPYPFDSDRPIIVRHERPKPEKPVDLNAFETMPVRMGIAPAPTPNPTLYRIEGPRNRPVTRVIRIAEAEPRHGRRSRHIHAETGAVLLTVPGR
jgi:hypothetical protein